MNSDWVNEVETDSNLPEGLFKESAQVIADTLFQKSDSYKQAMSRLNFYINRAGKNLSEDRKKVLENAKLLLKESYLNLVTASAVLFSEGKLTKSDYYKILNNI